jgi:hypothetical protein
MSTINKFWQPLATISKYCYGSITNFETGECGTEIHEVVCRKYLSIKLPVFIQLKR